MNINKVVCPNCGSDAVHYHEHGTCRTRTVCKKKCKGWKVITDINRMTGEKYIESEFKNEGF